VLSAAVVLHDAWLSLGVGGAQVLLPLVRGLFVGGVLSSFGAALFASLLLPPLAAGIDAKAAKSMKQACRRVLLYSIALALLAGLAWLFVETSLIVEAASLKQTIAAVPSVLLGTRFGQILALQMLALLGAGAAGAAARQGRWPATLLAGAATLLEAGHSHAFALAHGARFLLLSQALHVLAAGAWLGGLVPLFIVIKQVPLAATGFAARRFSTLGVRAVAILAATALYQGTMLAGGLSGLTQTAYGAVLMIKIALFAGLIGLAALNRFRLAPKLADGTSEASQARRRLLRSIAGETALGICVVLAASVLSGLEPGMQHR
jgi:putative copper export protein